MKQKVVSDYTAAAAALSIRFVGLRKQLLQALVCIGQRRDYEAKLHHSAPEA